MSRLCEILRKWGVWPTHEEGFQEEVDRLSRQGLRVIGIVEIVNPIVMIAVDALAVPYRWNHPLRLGTSGAIVALGVVTILASRTAWGNRRARLLSILSGWLAAGILTSGSLALAGEFPGSEHYIPAQIAAVLLVGAVVIPVEPLQALGLGLAIQATYAALGALAARLGVFVGSETDAAHHVFVGMLTGLTTALTAVVYRQRLATWRAHQEALRVLRDLRHAQSRALLSENAAALGRLAAALCHELNSPLGALTSAVDTLFLLSSRRPAAAGDHARLDALRDALRGTVSQSTQRLHEIVTRVLRLTELEQAEVQAANLNDLLQEVRNLLSPADQDRVELRLEPLPPLVCRPQQLTAVFSNLLRGAVQASNGGGPVTVSSRAAGGSIEVCVQDSGPGLSPQELATIFDPGFRASGGRISTGDWSLFGTRQVVEDHRGAIRVESSASHGTRVTVTLPC